MLTLYDSFLNSKTKFVPSSQSQVGLYVCGPTVYNEIHVGNARTVIAFDLLYRILKKEFPNVVYVRNITDIDDKIIKKANEENKSCEEIAKVFEESFNENCNKLQTLLPTYCPKATDTIIEIIEFIGNLIESGFAYLKDDHVYFDIKSINDYGALSGQNNVIAGKRIEVCFEKNNNEDFVLWKPSKFKEPYWNSPWGKGRPGWHIECSAMSAKFLGEKFDIHAGGQDLLFPHHENERAQNIGMYGKLAGPKYWLHNGMILFDGAKMSKSLGNTVLLSEIFKLYDPLIVKFFILSSHYRHSLNWKTESLNHAAARYKRWMFHLQDYLQDFINDDLDSFIHEEIYNPLLDDMNILSSFANFDRMLEDALKNHDKNILKQLASSLKWLGLISFKKDDENLIKILEEKLQERKISKQMKDYKKADEIRKFIEDSGYLVLDSESGSVLKKKI